jgi:hypothetical protein
MTLEHDIETINEYTQWKAVRQDTSPEAFVRDRAQQVAYGRLSKGIEFIENQPLDEDGGTIDWDYDQIRSLYKILNGEAD